MNPIDRAPQTESIRIRVTQQFREGLERVAVKAGHRHVSDFIRAACIEHAKRYGVEIGPVEVERNGPLAW